MFTVTVIYFLMCKFCFADLSVMEKQKHSHSIGFTDTSTAQVSEELIYFCLWNFVVDRHLKKILICVCAKLTQEIMFL